MIVNGFIRNFVGRYYNLNFLKYFKISQDFEITAICTDGEQLVIDVFSSREEAQEYLDNMMKGM